MLELLPDMSGQPWWVVVIVVSLLVAGSIGTRWVGARAGRSGEQEEDDAEGDRPARPGGQHAAVSSDTSQTTAVLTKALDLLASEAAESQDARAEVGRLRDELLRCSAEHDRVARAAEKAQADLEQCNRECRRLAMRALERGGDSGE